ncbi:MAG: non-homologous end-joining DNA ligase [Acidimicrobiales bacterium]
MPEPEAVRTEIAGRPLKVTNLSKVLYPLVGFTKAQVIDYYARIAPAMLPHIADRGITFKRWPDGVTADPFFNKRCPDHRPDWVDTCIGPGDRGGGMEYCRLTEVASLAWAANLAALEIHGPMARCDDLDAPTMLVFDLDPGEPATIIECAQVALMIRDVLDTIGLEAFAKTSGSKGMQLYVPLNTPHTHGHCSDFALAVAQLLEKQNPDAVTATMAKKKRPNKVFIDWSQNSHHKTTIAPYSLRGKERPTVSTPIDWDEVDECANGEFLSFEAADVLERVEEFGDLFEPAVTLEQHLPAPSG